MLVELREYQKDCVNAVMESWKTHRSCCVVLPCGGGKTVVFGFIAKKMMEQTGKKVLVIGHTEEIIMQAAQQMELITGQPTAIEMADIRSDLDIFIEPMVIVSTIQTQCSKKRNGTRRMEKFDPEQFCLVIIDECHRSLADSYKRIIEHYSHDGCVILGVTATPNRSDGSALGQIYSCCPYQLTLEESISQGWSVPIHCQSVIVDGLDYSEIGVSGGDFNMGEMSRCMEFEATLHKIARPTLDIIGDMKTLLYTCSIDHGERLCEVFNRYKPGSSKFICSRTPRDERRQILQDYREGKDGLHVILNVSVFQEGVDLPFCECVILARPSRSKLVVAQQVGRGCRILPNTCDGLSTPRERRNAIAQSVKTHLLVLDFVANLGKHDGALVTPTDVLGGQYDDEVVSRTVKKIQASGLELDISDELEKTEAEIEREQEEREATEIRERKIRSQLRAVVSYQTREKDPFLVLGIDPSGTGGVKYTKAKPTRKMVQLLTRNGVDSRMIQQMNRYEAGLICKEIIRRFHSSTCTFKQAMFLERFGYPADMLGYKAEKIILDIQLNGYKRLDEGERVQRPKPVRY